VPSLPIKQNGLVTQKREERVVVSKERETGGSSIERRGIWRGAAETGRSEHTQREKVPLFL
jgi:hypothetical protein